MKVGKWTSGILGFVLGLVVATAVFLAWPHNQTAGSDIYDRVSSLETRVTSIEKGLQEDAKPRAEEEAHEPRRMNRC